MPTVNTKIKHPINHGPLLKAMSFLALIFLLGWLLTIVIIKNMPPEIVDNFIYDTTIVHDTVVVHDTVNITPKKCKPQIIVKNVPVEKIVYKEKIIRTSDTIRITERVIDSTCCEKSAGKNSWLYIREFNKHRYPDSGYLWYVVDSVRQ